MEKLHELTKIDPWFINKMKGIISVHNLLERFNSSSGSPLVHLSASGVAGAATSERTGGGVHDLDRDVILNAKRKGFSDKQIALLVESSELVVRQVFHTSTGHVLDMELSLLKPQVAPAVPSSK